MDHEEKQNIPDSNKHLKQIHLIWYYVILWDKALNLVFQLSL